MTVRELTDDEKARLRKWVRRLAHFQKKAKEAREVVTDLATATAPEEGHYVDLDAGVVREREGEGTHPALDRAGIDNGGEPRS